MSAHEMLSHKERLLRQGMRLFYAQGFHGTTVDGILASAAVPKGSFYHHFGSKDVFGQAVLDRYMRFQIDVFLKWAARDDVSTPRKLSGYFTELSGIFVNSGYQRACLAGKFSTEVSATSELFRRQLADQIRSWKSGVIGLLRQGQASGDVRTDRSAADLADAVLSLIQGAFVLVLSTRDEHTLDAVATTIELLVEPPAVT
ncbi:MAG: TetR/AcrR family transcriptional regulator [Mycobacteriaceae bacterium]|nr:TetR/AcrR family transcriptional regulator [Mycobacteriaceae bacterium]